MVAKQTQAQPRADRRRLLNFENDVKAYTDFAIEDLTFLIAQAVSLGDEELVTRLDRVLRRVEDIVAASDGLLGKRSRH